MPTWVFRCGAIGTFIAIMVALGFGLRWAVDEVLPVWAVYVGAGFWLGVAVAIPVLRREYRVRYGVERD